MKKIDLTDQRFGHLVVLFEVPEEERRSAKKVAWRCLCDCGNEVIVSTDKLRGGEQLSCGHSCPYYKANFIKDLTGQRFGLLTVIEDSQERQCKSVMWKCRCDCGNIVIYNSQTLQKGRALSCGCLNESFGEHVIAGLLSNNNISFEREKTFDTCRFPDTNYLARFDFYVDNQYVIEFDGSQHFTANNYKWNTEEKVRATQDHDRFKNSWCELNNIPLIRIPYTHVKDICLQDLMLETSNFRKV